jgi:hypothetical protein
MGNPIYYRLDSPHQIPTNNGVINLTDGIMAKKFTIFSAILEFV